MARHGCRHRGEKSFTLRELRQTLGDREWGEREIDEQDRRLADEMAAAISEILNRRDGDGHRDHK